jgi:hypothetical protein
MPALGNLSRQTSPLLVKLAESIEDSLPPRQVSLFATQQ